MERKPLPIGIDIFTKLIDNGQYYVDKTLVIKDILDSKAAVTLFTRPRRFGKTLLLYTLRAFFEDARTLEGEKIDNAHYFDGLAIMDAGEQYIRHMGQHPVISLSLKSAKQPTYEMSYASLKDDIQREFNRHRYVLNSEKIKETEKQRFNDILDGKADEIEYAKALKFLSDCLYLYFGKKTVILIDEYDVPLENAHFRKFYDRMADFIRSLFESALKTNDSLEFSVITGCLRISKESIFTGLNNLKMVSILNPNYGEYFGFTPEEVDAMLHYYGLESKKEEMQLWYDGYLFGKAEVYNPWSVINYMDNAIADINYLPRPYWSNTSSNSIVKELIEKADSEARTEIEELIAGGSITKPVHEEITYDDIYASQDNLWNFLFFTGYLKKVREEKKERTTFATMKIPNEEVTYIYENTVRGWFDQQLKGSDMTQLITFIENGDCEQMASFLNAQLMETISFYDYREYYYHGFLAGLLKCQNKYLVTSNRESGDGRYDIILKERRFMGDVYILEIKVADKFQEMKEKCREALEQIEEKHYDTEMINEGYTIKGNYGLCFFKKGCIIRKA